MFDEVYEFGAGETLTQRYRLVIANGGWDAAQVEAVAGGWRGGIFSVPYTTENRVLRWNGRDTIVPPSEDVERCRDFKRLNSFSRISELLCQRQMTF